MFRSLIAIFLMALALTGCGSLRLVDVDVHSYATPPLVPIGASYQFERLPSQQANAERQNRFEAMAQAALNKVGLQRNDAAASYSVQVSVNLQVNPYSPWDRPPMGWWPGMNFGFGVYSRNLGFMGSGPFMPGFGLDDRPYYWRQVGLIIRNLSTHRVVYETHAAHDGPWADSEAILPAMFEAALKEFPNPPAGMRRVNIEIPR